MGNGPTEISSQRMNASLEVIDVSVEVPGEGELDGFGTFNVCTEKLTLTHDQLEHAPLQISRPITPLGDSRISVCSDSGTLLVTLHPGFLCRARPYRDALVLSVNNRLTPPKTSDFEIGIVASVCVMLPLLLLPTGWFPVLVPLFLAAFNFKIMQAHTIRHSLQLAIVASIDLVVVACCFALLR